MLADNFTLVMEALNFAAQKHTAQRRKDVAGTPYINHPIEVMGVLWQAGVRDEVLLAAALLHDTIEDTTATEEELRVRFGDEVTAVVLQVTDDKTLPKPDRKQAQIDHAPHLSDRAAQLKLADKTCNLRSLRHAPPAGWPPERLHAYVAWAEAVVAPFHGRFPALANIYQQEVQATREALSG
jgi:GTP diphosphokinase / guanosine-3',5'-bis(diphosphate) 3'-diphosphatase